MLKSLRPKLFPQLLASAGVTMMLMEFGAMYSWTSPYLYKFTRLDSPIPVSQDEGSWMASLMNVGRVIGALVGAVAVQAFGSRTATLLGFLPMITSWVLINLAKDVWWLYVARVFAGTGVGMGFSSFPLFIGEFAESSRRGSIVSFAFFGSPVAAIFTSYLGSALSHVDSSFYFAVPGILGVIIFLILPDTPHHLLKRSRLEAAERSLTWYRGGQDVAKELNEVKAYVELSSANTFMAQLREFREPYLFRALLIVVMLFAFMQTSGLNSIIFYMETILRESGSLIIDPPLVVVLAMVVGSVFSLISVFAIDRFGRRILMIVSSFGVTLGMVGLGTHFYLITHGWRPDDLQLLPVSSLFVFQATFTLGLLCVPSACLSEMMSQSTKGTAACLASVVSGLCAFASSKAYQPLVDYFGKSTVFFGHGVLAAVVIPFAIFIMPETKGKSLNQIQHELMKR